MEFLDISTVDFPGRLCSVLYTQGCNFHCAYCHNPELVSPVEQIEIEKTRIFGDRGHIDVEHHPLMDKIRGVRGIDGVCITGGEPTLQVQLEDLVHAIHWLDLDVKLDTNGSRPDVLEDMIPKVEYIAMDVKTTTNNYHKLGGSGKLIKKSVDILKEKGYKYEFRTTCVDPFVSLENIEEIGSLIDGARLHVLQPASFKNVLEPEYPMRACKTPEIEDMKSVLESYADEVEIR